MQNDSVNKRRIDRPKFCNLYEACFVRGWMMWFSWNIEQKSESAKHLNFFLFVPGYNFEFSFYTKNFRRFNAVDHRVIVMSYQKLLSINSYCIYGGKRRKITPLNNQTNIHTYWPAPTMQTWNHISFLHLTYDHIHTVVLERLGFFISKIWSKTKNIYDLRPQRMRKQKKLSHWYCPG